MKYKNILSIMSVLCLINVNAIADEALNQGATPLVQSHTIVGGWYPVFFTEYNQAQVDTIVKNYNAGRISRIVISYDLKSDLANKINNYILSHSTAIPKLEHDQNVDTATTQYEHNKVVLTIYGK